MLSQVTLAASLIWHASGTPLLSARASSNEQQSGSPTSRDGAQGISPVAGLGVIIARGVFICLLLGFLAALYYRRRKRAKEVTQVVPKPFSEVKVGPLPPAVAPHPRTHSKLFDDLMRAVYDAEDAAGIAHFDPAIKRKSIASGASYSGVSVESAGHRRMSLATLKPEHGNWI